MSAGAIAFAQYAIVVSLFAAAYFVGRAILRGIIFRGFSERLVFRCALGLGIISYLILCIGLLGWLTAVGVTLATVGATAIAVWFYPREPSSEVANEPKWFNQPPFSRYLILACLALAGLAFLPVWVYPLYPPSEPDVISYHLAAPMHWLRAHEVQVTPFLRYQVGPNLAHYLFAALLAVGGEIPPQIFSIVAVAFIGIGLYSWGDRLRGPTAGILATSLWLGSPATLEIARNASYHSLGALFAFVATYAVWLYGQSRHTGTLLWAGVFLGFAQSTWLGVFSFVPALLAAAIFFCVRERRMAPVILLGAGLLIGWGPTLLRSAWFTGNPTYPLLYQVFGSGPWWSATELAAIEGHVRHRYGVPRTLFNFLALPYSLVMSPGLFQQYYGYSVILSVLTPLVVVRAIVAKASRALVALLLFYVTCWFMFGQIMRYLLPIVPMLCLVGALAICWLGSYFGSVFKNRFRALATAAIVLACLAPGAWLLWKDRKARGPVPFTEQQREDYLAGRVVEYNAVIAANSDPGPIFALGDSNCAFFADDMFMGDFAGPGRQYDVIGKWQDPEALRAKLRQLGAKYLLMVNADGRQFPRGPGYDEYFEPVYADSSTQLFRIHQAPRTNAIPRKNMLANAGFDDLSDGIPVGWDRRGNPVVASPPGGASSGGGVAIEATLADGFQQVVPVRAGETYELGLQAKAGRGKVFRMQVNWADDSRIFATSIRLFEANDDWDVFVTRFTAPPCATRAEIYISSQTPDPVWLDSIEFNDTGAHDPRNSCPPQTSHRQ